MIRLLVPPRLALTGQDASTHQAIIPRFRAWNVQRTKKSRVYRMCKDLKSLASLLNRPETSSCTHDQVFTQGAGNCDFICAVFPCAISLFGHRFTALNLAFRYPAASGVTVYMSPAVNL